MAEREKDLGQIESIIRIVTEYTDHGMPDMAVAKFDAHCTNLFTQWPNLSVVSVHSGSLVRSLAEDIFLNDLEDIDPNLRDKVDSGLITVDRDTNTVSFRRTTEEPQPDSDSISFTLTA